MGGFWTPQVMEQRLPRIIDPFDPVLISESAYELRMGDEAYVTQADREPETKMSLVPGDRLVIPPGQFANLLTAERISVPNDALGLISIKFGLKRRGLLNVSGFHVDPGFDGKLVFAVYNAGAQDIVVSHGKPTFLLWFCDLVGPSSRLYGREERPGTRQHQTSISDDDVMDIRGHAFSPHALAARVTELEHRLATLQRVRTAVVGGFVAPVSTALVVATVVHNWDAISNWLGKLWIF